MENKYSKEAIRLIKESPKRLIENPCRKCSASYDGSCCGCPKHRKYKAIIDEYHKAGNDVLEVAKMYKKYTEAKKKADSASLYLKQHGLDELTR